MVSLRRFGLVGGVAGTLSLVGCAVESESYPDEVQSKAAAVVSTCRSSGGGDGYANRSFYWNFDPATHQVNQNNLVLTGPVEVGNPGKGQRDLHVAWKGFFDSPEHGFLMHRTWLSPSNNYGYYDNGTHALAIKMYPSEANLPVLCPGETKETATMDKLIWDVRAKDTNVSNPNTEHPDNGWVKEGEKVYVAFAIKFDNTVPDGPFDLVKRSDDYLLYQAWQGSVGTGRPPLSLHLRQHPLGSATPDQLYLEFVQNAVLVNNEWRAHPNGQRVLWGQQVNVERDQWQEFIIGHRFNTSGGWVTLWKREGSCFRRVIHRGDVSNMYDPSVATGGESPFERVMLGLGVYRKRQSATHTVFFDDIRTGPTFSSVLVGHEAGSSAEDVLCD